MNIIIYLIAAAVIGWIASEIMKDRASLLERGLTPPDLGSAFIGESSEFRGVLRLLERVAQADSTVLITGETGTGKEMAAKLVHARSARRTRPFITVECAALQESLLQSELFGHERGAFTGADRAKPGLFEVASGGTIFLDEIGEVSPATQVTLLRVLDDEARRESPRVVQTPRLGRIHQARRQGQDPRRLERGPDGRHRRCPREVRGAPAWRWPGCCCRRI